MHCEIPHRDCRLLKQWRFAIVIIAVIAAIVTPRLTR
jgi:Sec-independent protein secretion pathway component TatC